MNISHVICSRNRAAQLRATFRTFNIPQMRSHQIELILVDSDSTDDTTHVMTEFASVYPTTRIVRGGKGLGRARNAGVDAAKGDLIAFTDDDCYLDENYYQALRTLFSNAPRFHYGMGQILLHDETDDHRIANMRIAQQTIIEPGTAIPAGMFQGANIFFLREVFEKAGKFRDDMGSGTPFPCEDIEFGTRCSLAGFTGVLTPLVKVFHHHGRKAGSKDANETVLGYDTGRGAYYGSMIADGRVEAWKLWLITAYAESRPPSRAALERLEREMRGAADYIKYRLEREDRPGGGPAEKATQDNVENCSPTATQPVKA